MTSPRRPYEIVQDAEVTLEASRILAAMADALRDAAQHLESSTRQELEGVGMGGIIESLMNAASSGSERVSAIVVERLEAVAAEAGLTTAIAAPVTAAAVTQAVVVQDAGRVRNEKKIPILGVSVPEEMEEEANAIVQQARTAVAAGNDGPGPFVGDRGRWIWRTKLYSVALKEALASTVPSAPRISPAPVAAASPVQTVAQESVEVDDLVPPVVPVRPVGPPSGGRRPPLSVKSAQGVSAQRDLNLGGDRGDGLGGRREAPTGGAARRDVGGGSEERVRPNLGLTTPFDRSHVVLAEVDRRKG